MRSCRRYLALIIVVGTIVGCGIYPTSPDALPATDDQVVTAVDQAEPGDAIDAPEPVVMPAPASPAPNPTASDPETSTPAPAIDLGFPLSDIALFPDYLSLFVDGLVLDLLPPTTSTGSVSYLEQLCRDTGIPDHRCRQLYGN